MARLSARSSLSEHLGRAQMQFLDRREPRQPERFARDDDDKRQRGGDGKRQPEKAEALAARKQILDQTGDAEPEAEQHQPADARSRTPRPSESRVAPGPAAPRSAPAAARDRLPA